MVRELSSSVYLYMPLPKGSSGYSNVIDAGVAAWTAVRDSGALDQRQPQAREQGGDVPSHVFLTAAWVVYLTIEVPAEIGGVVRRHQALLNLGSGFPLLAGREIDREVACCDSPTVSGSDGNCPAGDDDLLVLEREPVR